MAGVLASSTQLCLSSAARAAPRASCAASRVAAPRLAAPRAQPTRFLGAARALAPRRAAAPAFATRSVATMALKAGDNMADFPDYFRALPTQDGTQVALSNYKDKKTVVVFFYPKDDTPGCTKEACSFRDSYTAFTDAGCEVVGVSSDPPASHAAFKAKHRLPYTLLSDERSFMRNGFGIPSDLFGMLPGRQTYVIGKDGKCLLAFNSQMEPEKHVSEALRVIKAAK